MLENIFEWPNGQPLKRRMLGAKKLAREGCNEVLARDTSRTKGESRGND